MALTKITFKRLKTGTPDVTQIISRSKTESPKYLQIK